MTDTKQNYTIDEIALQKAGIDPRTCYESVQCAVDRKLTGYEKAESYLEQLWEQIEAGTLEPALVLPPPDGEIGSDEVYLSAEDAENWQPEDNPFNSQQPKINKADSKKPAQSSTLLMLAMLIEELGFYQKYDKQGRKGGQIATINHFQELAEKYRIYGKLSKTTLQRNIADAKNTLREHSHIKDD